MLSAGLGNHSALLADDGRMPLLEIAGTAACCVVTKEEVAAGAAVAAVDRVARHYRRAAPRRALFAVVGEAVAERMDLRLVSALLRPGICGT